MPHHRIEVDERCPRIDHQGYAPETWAGLLLTALYLIQAERVIGPINDGVEFFLYLITAIGSTLCLLGAAIGTRLFFPRARRSTSYGFQLLGLPLIIVSMAWFTYAAHDGYNLLMIALGGGLGLFIEVASVRMFVKLVVATRELP